MKAHSEKIRSHRTLKRMVPAASHTNNMWLKHTLLIQKSNLFVSHIIFSTNAQISLKRNLSEHLITGSLSFLSSSVVFRSLSFSPIHWCFFSVESSLSFVLMIQCRCVPFGNSRCYLNMQLFSLTTLTINRHLISIPWIAQWPIDILYLYIFDFFVNNI